MMFCGRRRPRAAPPSCVLITGAGGSFGRALAERFAREGSSLVLVDVDASSLAGTVSACGAPAARVASLLCDVSDGAAVASLPARISATRLPRVDVVISNAAIARGAPSRVLAVNIAAAFHLAAAFRVGAGGVRVFVLVSSIMGTLGAAGMAAYVASKWALLGMAASLRLELQRDGRDRDVAVIAALPYASSEGDMFRGIYAGPRNSRLAGCIRGACCPRVAPSAVAATIADAVLAGESATFSCPAHMLTASRALLCCLPMRTHDWLTGFFGGWHGAPEQWAEAAADADDDDDAIADAAEACGADAGAAATLSMAGGRAKRRRAAMRSRGR